MRWLFKTPSILLIQEVFESTSSASQGLMKETFDFLEELGKIFDTDRTEMPKIKSQTEDEIKKLIEQLERYVTDTKQNLISLGENMRQEHREEVLEATMKEMKKASHSKIEDVNLKFADGKRIINDFQKEIEKEIPEFHKQILEFINHRMGIFFNEMLEYYLQKALRKDDKQNIINNSFDRTFSVKNWMWM